MNFLDSAQLYGAAIGVGLVAGCGLYFTAKAVAAGADLYDYGKFSAWSTPAFFLVALLGYAAILLLPHGWTYLQLIGAEPVGTTAGFVDALSEGVDEKTLLGIIKAKMYCAPIGFAGGALVRSYLK